MFRRELGILFLVALSLTLTIGAEETDLDSKSEGTANTVPNVNATDIKATIDSVPNVNTTDIKATNGSVPNVNTTDFKAIIDSVPNVNATDIKATNGSVPNVNTTDIKATTGSVPNVNATNIKATNGSVPNVNATDIKATNGSVPNVNTTNIKATNGSVPNVNATDIKATNGSVPNVNTTDFKATIDFLSQQVKDLQNAINNFNLTKIYEKVRNFTKTSHTKLVDSVIKEIHVIQISELPRKVQSLEDAVKNFSSGVLKNVMSQEITGLENKFGNTTDMRALIPKLEELEMLVKNSSDHNLKNLVNKINLLETNFTTILKAEQANHINQTRNDLERLLKNFTVTNPKVLVENGEQLPDVFKKFNFTEVSELLHKVESLQESVKSSASAAIQKEILQKITALENKLKNKPEMQTMIPTLEEFKRVVNSSLVTILQEVVKQEIKGLQDTLKVIWKDEHSEQVKKVINDMEQLLKNSSDTNLEKLVQRQVKEFERMFKEFNYTQISGLLRKVESLEDTVKYLPSDQLKSVFHEEIIELGNKLNIMNEMKTISHELEVQRSLKNSLGPGDLKVIEKEIKEVGDILKDILNAGIKSEISPSIPFKDDSKKPNAEDALPVNAVPVPVPKETPEDRRGASPSGEYPKYPEPKPYPADLKEFLPNGTLDPSLVQQLLKLLTNPNISGRTVTEPPPPMKPPTVPKYYPDHVPGNSRYRHNYNHGRSGGDYFRSFGDRGYEFGYMVDSPEKDTHYERHEERNSDVVTGSYSVLLPDGRLETVEYVADENGYRPTVTYSRP